jgi:hypothetical protein
LIIDAKARAEKTGDIMPAIATCREATSGHQAVESTIATLLAVPCWSSWKAAMCFGQPKVVEQQPSWTGPEGRTSQL